MDKKIKELENRLDALVIAIPKEVASFHFYTELAEKAESEGARQMFIELAQQEIIHKERLEKYLKSLENEIAELKKER